VVTNTVERPPRCDFRDLYPGPDAPGLLADLDDVARAVATFRGQYGGRLAHLTAPTLLDAVRGYETLAERAARLASYATLLAATNGIAQTAPTTVNTIRVRIGAALSLLTFVPRELGQLSEGRFEDLVRAPDAARYAPWLERLRAVRGHLPSDPAEQQSAEEAAVGRAEWVRQYDELMAALRVPSEHGPISVGAALRLQSAPDPGVRAAAARALATTLDAHGDRFTCILNALLEQKQIEDRRRGFHRPDGERNCLNRLGDEVDLVLAAVRARAPLAHRFYRL
jgi:oligoendopeptidase F